MGIIVGLHFVLQEAHMGNLNLHCRLVVVGVDMMIWPNETSVVSLTR